MTYLVLQSTVSFAEYFSTEWLNNNRKPICHAHKHTHIHEGCYKTETIYHGLQTIELNFGCRGKSQFNRLHGNT